MDANISKKSYLHKLYAFLPPPLSITDSQFNDYFEWMASTFESSLISKDFETISELMRISQNLYDNSLLESSPIVAKRFLLACYPILILWPIISYDIQIQAFLTISHILTNNSEFENLSFNWEPIVRFCQHLTSESETVPSLIDNSETIDAIFTVMHQISDYFPESATDPLLDYYLPRIGHRGGSPMANLTMLGRLNVGRNRCPVLPQQHRVAQRNDARAEQVDEFGHELHVQPGR
jgi:hypothetical protein